MELRDRDVGGYVIRGAAILGHEQSRCMSTFCVTSQMNLMKYCEILLFDYGYNLVQNDK